MKYAVNQLANDTLAPSIDKLLSSTTSMDEKSDLNDILLCTFIILILIAALTAILVVRKRVDCSRRMDDWCPLKNIFGVSGDDDGEEAAQMDNTYLPASHPIPPPTNCSGPSETGTIATGTGAKLPNTKPRFN